MKKVLSSIILVFAIISCNKEETVLNSPYLGEYKTTSITSDIAMDLNKDGIATDDFLKELAIYYDRFTPNIQATLILYSFPNPSTNTIDDFIPRQFLNSPIPEEEFEKSSASNSITYNSNFTKVVNIDRYFSITTLLQQRIAIIDNVELLPNKKIKIHYRQQYYTVTTGWKLCNLIATYESLN